MEYQNAQFKCCNKSFESVIIDIFLCPARSWRRTEQLLVLGRRAGPGRGTSLPLPPATAASARAVIAGRLACLQPRLSPVLAGGAGRRRGGVAWAQHVGRRCASSLLGVGEGGGCRCWAAAWRR